MDAAHETNLDSFKVGIVFKFSVRFSLNFYNLILNTTDFFPKFECPMSASSCGSQM